MYVEIFKDHFIDSEKVAGVFDLDNTTTNKFTNAFLNSARRRGKVTYLGTDIPKSFLLMEDGSVLIAEPSAQVLKRRFENGYKFTE